jgi:hypothetical protein
MRYSISFMVICVGICSVSISFALDIKNDDSCLDLVVIESLSPDQKKIILLPHESSVKVSPMGMVVVRPILESRLRCKKINGDIEAEEALLKQRYWNQPRTPQERSVDPESVYQTVPEEQTWSGGRLEKTHGYFLPSDSALSPVDVRYQNRLREQGYAVPEER